MGWTEESYHATIVVEDLGLEHRDLGGDNVVAEIVAVNRYVVNGRFDSFVPDSYLEVKRQLEESWEGFGSHWCRQW